MPKMCYLCQRKSSKRDRVSLHVIPKEPIARHKWMEVCNFSPSDDLRFIYICSMHFSDNHIDRGNQFQTRCTLKNGAVPSIGVPNPISFHNENIETLNVGTGTENNMEINKIETVEEVLFEQRDNFIKVCRFDTADVTMDSEVDENFEKPNESHCSKPSNRRFFEPRYVSEIEISDFQSPGKTKRILNLVREADKRKSKLIKALQDRNRKLQKRISALQQKVTRLKEEKKKENVVSNETGNGFSEPSTDNYEIIVVKVE